MRKWSNLTCAYFSKWVETLKPPTSSSGAVSAWNVVDLKRKEHNMENQGFQGLFVRESFEEKTMLPALLPHKKMFHPVIVLAFCHAIFITLHHFYHPPSCFESLRSPPYHALLFQTFNVWLEFAPGTVLTVVDKLLQRHLLMSPDFKQPLAMCMIMRLAWRRLGEDINFRMFFFGCNLIGEDVKIFSLPGNFLHMW